MCVTNQAKSTVDDHGGVAGKSWWVVYRCFQFSVSAASTLPVSCAALSVDPCFRSSQTGGRHFKSSSACITEVVGHETK